jgi:hypothetical protein
MSPMGRSILAVLLGVVVGGLLIATVEFVSHLIYPPQPDLDPAGIEALKAAIANDPVGALLFILLAWALGSLGGGWIAASIARRSHTRHALIVGAILMVMGILNMVMIPHPLWFWLAALVLFLPASYLGAKLGRPRVQPETSPA